MALKSQPVLKMTIPERGTLSTAVVGLAMLHNLLYVVYKKSFNVFVYDTKDAQLRQVSVTLRDAALLADIFSSICPCVSLLMLLVLMSMYRMYQSVSLSVHARTEQEAQLSVEKVRITWLYCTVQMAFQYQTV